MAQYQSLTNLCRQNEQVRTHVNELASRCQFPYKLRCLFATWIESQNWQDINLQSDEGMKKAESLFKELSLNIHTTVTQLVQSQFDLAQVIEMDTCWKSLQQRFEGNYDTFVQVVRQCLMNERLLIESACQTQEDSDLRRKNPKSVRGGVSMEISQSLDQLQREISLAESQVKGTAEHQKQFFLQYNQLQERIKSLDQQAQQASDTDRSEYQALKAQTDNNVKILTLENFKLRNGVADTIINLAIKLAQQLTLIYKEIEKWNISQKRAIAALSEPQENELELVDKLYDDGGKLLCSMVQLVERTIAVFTDIPYSADEKLERLKVMHKELKDEYLVSHLQSAFVVDRHPDRVLKVSGGKSLGFSMSVRILGGVGLGLAYNPSMVKVVLCHERDLKEPIENAEGVCQICNGDERQFTVNRGTNVYSALFNSVLLKSVRRPDRGRNEELVTEHKYAFVFTTQVHSLGKDIPLKVVSLPIILTSQTSQEIMAKGTLIWDAAFSEQDRILFQYKETVRWGEVAQVLNSLFFQNTGRTLTREHLDYLACMVFRSKAKIDDVDNKLITEKQVIRFSTRSSVTSAEAYSIICQQILSSQTGSCVVVSVQEKLPRLDFSFWKWFWSCMNLVKNYVREEWNSGLIYGFISKEDAKRLLMDKPCGTFLLRFSETNIENSQKSDISGYLTLAVMEIDPNSGQKKLFHVKEYLSPKDLQERKLCPVLDAMEVADLTKPGAKKRLLRYVYPDTSTTFEDRFGQFIRNTEQTGDSDYLRGKYNIEIFLTDNQARRNRQNSVDGENASYPPTPYASQVFSPQSPISTAASPMPPVPNDQELGDILNGGLTVEELSQIVTRPSAAVRPLEPQMYSPADGVDGSDLPVLYDLPADGELFELLQTLGSDMQLGFDADNDLIIQSTSQR